MGMFGIIGLFKNFNETKFVIKRKKKDIYIYIFFFVRIRRIKSIYLRVKISFLRQILKLIKKNFFFV